MKIQMDRNLKGKQVLNIQKVEWISQRMKLKGSKGQCDKVFKMTKCPINNNNYD